MNKLLVLLFIITTSQLFAQTPISKEKAIEIALKNGLNEGLEPPQAKLTDCDSIWEISCLQCDDNDGITQVIQISANTGQLKFAYRTVEIQCIFCGRQLEKTRIKPPISWDSLPEKTIAKKPYELTKTHWGTEQNPVISNDSKHVAFEYSYSNIGVASIDGENIEKICEECYSPQWIDNEWLAYQKEGIIYKTNIKTHQTIQITKKENGYFNDAQISPDYKWIAYTSSEVWSIPGKDSIGRPVLNIHIFMDGNGQEMCLLSTNGKQKKFITKTGKLVNTPCWSSHGDTLFFNIENTIFFATDLDRDSVTYSRLNTPSDIMLSDYIKVAHGIFPLKQNCKILGVARKSLHPQCILNKEPGRYGDLVLSKDLKYLVFTDKDSKNADKQLWVMKFK